VATEDPDILKHLGEASELCGTAAANVLGQNGEARICERGILHGLIALCLLVRQGQERDQEARQKREAVLDEALTTLHNTGKRLGVVGEDPANRGPSA
jgi:hypothetical protein